MSAPRTPMKLPALVRAGAVAANARTDLIRAVIRARENGATWSDIGDALDMTKQAAWEQFKDWDTNDDGALWRQPELLR